MVKVPRLPDPYIPPVHDTQNKQPPNDNAHATHGAVTLEYIQAVRAEAPGPLPAAPRRLSLLYTNGNARERYRTDVCATRRCVGSRPRLYRGGLEPPGEDRAAS